MAYDGALELPGWWITRFVKARNDLGWDNSVISTRIREYRPEKKWGPDRISKMQTSKRGTISMVVAISDVLDLPSPVVVAVDEADAEALKLWRVAHRRRDSSSVPGAKFTAVTQALDTAIEAASDQTRAVPSDNEGVTPGRGPRRPARGR